MNIDDLLKKIFLPLDVQEYYELLDYKNREEFCIGQIISGFVTYPIQKKLQTLSLSKYNPTEETKAQYIVEDFNFDTINDCRHRPILDDNLEYDEYYIIQKGKIRPCVILNVYQSRYENSNYDEKFYLCAPIYSIKKKHTSQYVLDIIKFDIPSEFYLPKDCRGISDHSFIRFGRIIPLFKKNIRALECPIANNKPFRLSDKTIKLVTFHLAKYFSFDFNYANNIEKEINAYKEIINNSCEKLD